MVEKKPNVFNVNHVKKVEKGVIIIDKGINNALLIGNNKEIRIGLEFISILLTLLDIITKINNKEVKNK